jgi:hypothetical protein
MDDMVVRPAEDSQGGCRGESEQAYSSRNARTLARNISAAVVMAA